MVPLAFNLTFPDLYNRDGLSRLDQAFLHELALVAPELHHQLVHYRVTTENIPAKDISNFLIAVAPYVEDFIAVLFSIQKEVNVLAAQHQVLAPLYACKRLFVQRQALKKFKEEDAKPMQGNRLKERLENYFESTFSELTYAEKVMQWQEDKVTYEAPLTCAMEYAAWAVYSEEGQQWHKDGVLFKVPRKREIGNFFPVDTEVIDGVTVVKGAKGHYRYRDGFALTDTGFDLTKALDEVNYCIFCHNQGKDSCSKGFKEKDGKAFRTSEHEVTLAGCPLEEKISEMHTVKSQGAIIGALAFITVDNPLCALTGHRICNDCMKSCIYQKQDPVNIPATETRILQDVLSLPYGFEIYSLLTRWNPLNLTRPLPRPSTGYKILVVGMGPAGCNLSHHLLNDGHTVIAVDGLKIEPLSPEYRGTKKEGEMIYGKLVKDITTLYERLDERVLAGFGGVAEYGITVRWNKNFLKVVRLLLERRDDFALFGGVRFGSTITYEDAFAYGFDHIALCVGAGRPTLVPMKNALTRGVRTASDFLMALQLTGAAKKDSIANLQMRLPVLVIGGGLTAVDTATESLAYYPVQVEKFLRRYEILVRTLGEKEVRGRWPEEDQAIADEFISHAQAIRAERELARAEQRDPNIIGLLNQWGGVHIVYRKRLEDSPSYRLNHEEVEKALEEGIGFIENATPLAVIDGPDAHAIGLQVAITQGPGEKIEKVLPARSIFVAAGTNPNTVLQREDPTHFSLDGKYFQAIDGDGMPVVPEFHISKPNHVQILIHKADNQKYVSCFGDVHPSYVGNVVKAMGSAKQGYPIVSKVLSKEKPASSVSSGEFIAQMEDKLQAVIYKVNRLTPTIIEVIVRAPAAAKNFLPGQFYRLQNYEAESIKVGGVLPTTLAMEGLALTGAWVDKEKGLLSTIVLEMGGSSDLCAFLKEGEPVVLMGPTGTPTHITSGETVLLVGGGLGNAVLFSIGKTLRAQGSKVLYFAGYRKAQDRYKVKEIEDASDIIIWACDEAAFTPEREQDRAFHGNIVQAIEHYAKGFLGGQTIKLQEVDRIICIGSDRMMEAVSKARHTILKPYLKPEHIALGSINSPMQCMMKEICAQCLQKHKDPVTGEETYVYSCYNQDQCLDKVDFTHLHQRLKQNTVQERLTAKWIDYCLKNLQLRGPVQEHV